MKGTDDYLKVYLSDEEVLAVVTEFKDHIARQGGAKKPIESKAFYKYLRKDKLIQVLSREVGITID